MPTTKNRFQVLNLHPKKHIIKEKKYFFFDASKLDKFHKFSNERCNNIYKNRAGEDN